MLFGQHWEEITEADLLVHIVDAAHDNAIEQQRTVLGTLDEIGAGDIPILTVFNKIDLLNEPAREEMRQIADPQAIFISAKTGEGFEALLAAIERELIRSIYPDHGHAALRTRAIALAFPREGKSTTQ